MRCVRISDITFGKYVYSLEYTFPFSLFILLLKRVDTNHISIILHFVGYRGGDVNT